MALQTLLKEYTEVSKSPKENKLYSQLQPAKMRPRRKARKYLYAIGSLSHSLLYRVVLGADFDGNCWSEALRLHESLHVCRRLHPPAGRPLERQPGVELRGALRHLQPVLDHRVIAASGSQRTGGGRSGGHDLCGGR